MKQDDARAFPVHILQATVSERIGYFIEHRIAHTRLKSATDDIFSRLKSMTIPDIIIATGPTGVGKTTMANSLKRSVLDLYSDRLKKDCNAIPVVSVTAVPPTEGSYDWKDFGVRTLRTMSEPLIDRKILCPGSYDPQQSPKSAIRAALESALINRKVEALIVDEAHHMLMVANPRRLKHQFETLKSLATQTGTSILLMGTYDLLQIRDQSGQLVRRSHIVHLPRYDARDTDDREEFISALYTFQKHLPFEIEPDLCSEWRFYYLKSLGCIGILKTWLDRCLEKALESHCKTMDREFANKHAHDNKELQTILNEALAGEAEMKDCTLAELELDVFAPDAAAKEEKMGASAQRGKRRIGIPKAKRHPKGANHD